MKRTGLLLVTGAIVALTILYVGAAAPTPAPGTAAQIEQLKKEVADLRQRVENLEEQWKNDLVPATRAESKIRPDVINPYPSLRQVPQNWTRGEFNGIPYYIVPINHPRTPPTEVKPQTPPDRASAATGGNTPSR